MAVSKVSQTFEAVEPFFLAVSAMLHEMLLGGQVRKFGEGVPESQEWGREFVASWLAGIPSRIRKYKRVDVGIFIFQKRSPRHCSHDDCWGEKQGG